MGTLVKISRVTGAETLGVTLGDLETRILVKTLAFNLEVVAEAYTSRCRGHNTSRYSGRCVGEKTIGHSYRRVSRSECFDTSRHLGQCGGQGAF